MPIFDAYGRPLPPRDLPDGIDVYFQTSDISALSSWNTKTAWAAAVAHSAGDFSISARMFWAMLGDPRVLDGVGKRALALRGLGYKVIPGKGQRAKTVAAKFEAAFPQMRPARVLQEQMAQTLLLGLCVHQPIWGYARDHLERPAPDIARFADDGWFYPRLRTWEPTCLRHRSATVEGEGLGRLEALAWGSERGQQVILDVPVNPGSGQWIVHTGPGDQKPHLYGKMLAIWRAWIERLLAALGRIRFNDVHGSPIRVAKVPMGMRETAATQKFYDGVKNLGRDSSLLLPQMSDGKVPTALELVEAKSETWKSLQSSFYDQGREITICVTGGTQNTEAEGGNYKGAEEQREIRHEVKEADAIDDAGVLNQQLCIPFAVLNGYDPEEACTIVYDTAPAVSRSDAAKADQEEMKALQEVGRAVQELRKAGYEVDVQALLKQRGQELPGRRIAVPAEPPPPDQSGAAPAPQP